MSATVSPGPTSSPGSNDLDTRSERTTAKACRVSADRLRYEVAEWLLLGAGTHTRLGRQCWKSRCTCSCAPATPSALRAGGGAPPARRRNYLFA
jgi:hypothetical protein